MDIVKARKLLGPKYAHLTDNEVKEIMSLIRAVCKRAIAINCKQPKGGKKK